MVSEVPIKAYAMKALDSQAGSAEVAAARGEAPQLAIFSISSKSSVSNLSIFLSEGEKKGQEDHHELPWKFDRSPKDSKAVWGGTPCGTVMLPSTHKAGCLRLSSRHQGH